MKKISLPPFSSSFLHLTLPFLSSLIPYLTKSSHSNSIIPSCLFFNFLFLLATLLTSQASLPALHKDRIILTLAFSSLLVNSELFWRPYFVEFSSFSRTESILIYLGSLSPLFSCSWFGDQITHWILVTIYSAITNFFTTELGLIYGLTLASVLLHAKRRKSLRKTLQKEKNPSRITNQLMKLLIQDSEKACVVLNKNLEVIATNCPFEEAFPHGIAEALDSVTKIECFKRIQEIIDRGTSIQPKQANDASNLGVLVKLLLNFSDLLKTHDLEWDTNSKAIYQENQIYLSFAFIEEEGVSGKHYPLLLLKLDLNNKNKIIKDPSQSLSFTEIASIVHDLRTPLNGTIFFLQKAMDNLGVSQEVKHDLLEPSLESAKRLNYIINDLLDFAQILEGKFRLSFETFDLQRVLQVPVQIIKALGASKGISVSFDIDYNVPKFITSDQNRLVQIVYNLLGNAFKFTKEGSIRLHVSLSPTSTQHIEFAVKDTGFGIKPGDLAKLFKTFEKLDNWHDNTVGTGLGLCISNAIVKSLGGKSISVKSEYQKGSTFSFSIEDKLLQKIRTSPKQKTIKQSIFGQQQEAQPSSGSLKRNPESFSLLQNIQRNNPTSEAKIYSRHLSRLESNELLLETTFSPIVKNPTVQYDFNNPSQESGFSIFKRQNKEIHHRHPNTVIETKTRYPLDSDLVIDKVRRSTLEAPKPEKIYSRSEANSPACSCYQIIAVDDEPMNLMAIKMMCLELGLKVLCFTRGEDAIEHFTEGRKGIRCVKCIDPLLILMDCHMPGKDGYETAVELQKLMKNGKMAKLPIYACSADDSPVFQEKVMKSGMDGFLTKPVDKEKLYEIAKACKAKQNGFPRKL